MSDATRKIFVIDTNVILHDAGCLRNFEEHDIAIPITVLEELDQFKRGSDDIHFQAREFLRRLDGLTGDVLAPDGSPIGAGLGFVRVVLGTDRDERLRAAFLQDTPDHRILASTLMLHRQAAPRQVVLVSKDTNLRMKAKSLGLRAEDYESDKVESFDTLYKGKRTIEGMPSEMIDRFYAEPDGVPAAELSDVAAPRANENFVLRNGSKSALATFRPGDRTFVRVEKQTAYGITPRNSEQSFALKALLNDDIKLVTLAGTAGTGKTLLALAAGLHKTLKEERFDKLLTARPIMPLGRDIGYLPGDKDEKLSMWMQPIFDNISYLLSTRGSHVDERPESRTAEQRLDQLMATGRVVMEPLTYIRGRSIPHQFMIVDEAQNLSPHEIKTIVSRVGDGTKIVLCGDIFQIDNPYLDAQSNGLAHCIERFKGQRIAGHVSLSKTERSNLASLAAEIL